jgi:hypothetical protein
MNIVTQTTTNMPMNVTRQTATIDTSTRRIAAVAGLLYLITHVTSIGAFALYEPILNNAGYIAGSGSDTQVLLGVLFEIILGLAVVGTAVTLFPVMKRWNEGVALGYAGLRTLEAGIIAIGVFPLLAIVTLRQQMMETVATDPATLTTISNTLVALYQWTVLLGPGLVCGTNTVLMAYLMYRSHLVPRFIPVLGLIGGPLIFIVSAAKMFGFVEQNTPLLLFAVFPIFAWEVSLALWLIVKGFNQSAVASELNKTTAHPQMKTA